MEEKRKNELTIIANNIRKHVLTAVYTANSGHIGGSLSMADTLCYLYFEEMNIPDPDSPDRDRFVLSKGHCAPALYGVLAEKGIIDKELIPTFRHIDSILQGHPDMKGIPGVDMSSGSLGQGISAACGMALNAKSMRKNYRVYTFLGDGELQEGQVWEAAMFASHYKLDNLTAIVDFNGLQIDGKITDVMSPLPIDKKFEAFGWNVVDIDAHNFDDIERAFNVARNTKNQPTLILQKSTKGKNVSFMENNPDWHGSPPNQQQFEQAIAEINSLIEKVGVQCG